MRKLSTTILMLLVSVTLGSTDLWAASFYQGKAVRITVGFSAGGGYDLWARIVARHMGKHIPGNPTIVVENITGAGGLIQANQLFKATKADGLTIGHIDGGLIQGQTVGQPGYEFDSQKFIYIGAANKQNQVFVFTKKSGITSAEKWQTSPKPVMIGGLMTGNSLDNTNKVMKHILNFPTQIITGYKGLADIRVAIESGELDGTPTSFDSFTTSMKKWVDSGDMFVVLQAAAKPLKGLPNLPRIIDFAKNDEEKKLVEILVHYVNDYSRPFALPPATPKDRVEILRKAFQSTMEDKEFQAEINKMRLSLDPTSWEDLTAAVANSAQLDPATKARIRDLLFK